jgi:uncharacterized protein DUF4058
MPLRDHFRPPLDDLTSWEQFHAQWPAMIVLALQRRLPPRYVAGPRVHLGSMVEIDVATFEQEGSLPSSFGNGNGGIATAVWAPAKPTLTVAADLIDQDEYEVLIHDMKRGRRLVAAIEIVSPANKDRPEHRRLFVAKCAALLQRGVSVAIVDLVTTRNFNLYGELLAFIGLDDPALGPKPPSVYAAACRCARRDDGSVLEAWAYPLELGRPLPTLPIWLADNFNVPLELEACYEETCRVLRIP